MIMLKDVLHLDYKNTKIPFNKSNADLWKPMDLFKSGDNQQLMSGQY